MEQESKISAEQVYAEELEKLKQYRRIEPDKLVGVGLSGGGIRSATFALGVLEGLKESHLLKQVDYLSSVSGGGYIAGWLAANCERVRQQNEQADKKLHTEDWLDAKADWGKSIWYLRRYANYLSPKLGFFSADTWVMGTIWLRNTLLVQLTLILLFATVLLLPRPLFGIFQSWSTTGNWRWLTVIFFVAAIVGIAGNLLRLNSVSKVAHLHGSGWAAGICFTIALLAAAIGLSLISHLDVFTNGIINPIVIVVAPLLVLVGFAFLPVGVALLGKAWSCFGNAADKPEEINYTQGWVQLLVIVPLILSGYLMAAVLWGQTIDMNVKDGLRSMTQFSQFFLEGWRYWPLPLSVAGSSLWLLSFCSVRRDQRGKWLWVALLAPIPALGVLHALLCVIMLILHVEGNVSDVDRWFAFIWGPPMLLYAFALSIVMLLGMMGRQSTEAVREWWSRMGAWLCIYGFVWMVVMVAAVYGPLWVAAAFSASLWHGSPFLAWLGTTLAGLFAAKSGATSGTRRGAKSVKSGAQKALEILAKIAPFVFVAGVLILVATGARFAQFGVTPGAPSSIGIPDHCYWTWISKDEYRPDLWVFVSCLAALLIMTLRVDINEFSLNAFYRSRLARCYLGATRVEDKQRDPQAFTGFDEQDDMSLDQLSEKSLTVAPLLIINCALNLGGSSDLSLHTRHSASFAFTPYRAGSGYVWKDLRLNETKLGFRLIGDYGGKDWTPTLAQVMSISGAAASPNMGYHTSPVVAFMLTVFNVRLGNWFPNPLFSGVKSPSPRSSLSCLIMELFGIANAKSDYLMLSDGGHFENLGAYELIARKCRVVIISDAECDPDLKFEGLGALIRMCQVDLGAEIRLKVDAIRRLDDGGDCSGLRSAVGEIIYKNCDYRGILIYLKASMTGHEDSSVLQYKDSHPDFPHESTGNQFYGEDQFESYRRLGRDIAESVFGMKNRRPQDTGRSIIDLAADLQTRAQGLETAVRPDPDRRRSS